ncbi:MAG: phosphotransferase [Asgard group archaeon]|nr:phosphotransferase [Asgard group archaeon]
MSYKSSIPITKKQLSKIIKEHFPEQKIIKIVEITESFVNPVYSFSLDTYEEFILKVNNPRWPFKQQREIEAIKKAKTNTSIPIPNIITYSITNDPFSYTIFEKAPGIELREAINKEKLTSKEIINIIKKIGSYLGQLHNISFNFYGDFTSVYKLVDKNRNYLWGNRFDNWLSCFKAYCYDIINWVDKESFSNYRPKLKEKINEYMEQMPESENSCFVHSDIQPSNIIINETGISAIIDFEWSFAGSPSFDYHITQAGFYFSIFPTLSDSKMFKIYPDITLEKIRHAFLEGYRLNNNFTLKSMPPDLMDFIWLLYMIGSWNWTKQTSTKSELKRYKEDIQSLYSKIIS